MKDRKLYLYNSLSGQKEEFCPIASPRVGMYVCGPTVYSNVHLGNVRTFLNFDFVYRCLRYLGYQVRYVRNITDAGHLTDDGDVNNDRFVKQSRLEKLEPMEIVQKYTVNLHQVLEKFNLLPPTIEPTATGHILEQIELTQNLIEKGLAYEVNGSVYFDVASYNARGLNYGELSHRNLDELMTGSRDLDGQNEKRSPVDFALWKAASPAHIMRWKSPWGEGFPGWHLECTAMSTKYLGNEFDIHGGGIDLKFPHHECEIAQGKGCNGVSPVRYWMHANMLTMNSQRMSKSTGNYILPEQLISGENDFFEKPFHPAVVRFNFLQAHYRSVLDISNEAMLASEKGYQRLNLALDLVEHLKTSEKSSLDLNAWKDKCLEAICDDFNAPILISHLFEAVKWIFLIDEGKEKITPEDLHLLKTTLRELTSDVLGLESIQINPGGHLDHVLALLIELRTDAKKARDFELSDRIRDRLLEAGIQLKDTREGTSWQLL